MGVSAVVREKLRAFHGSPYSFDRFSTDQIGTGEGAQAYGRGLYFAEREGTARSYRDSLSSRNPNPTYKGRGYDQLDGPEYRALAAIEQEMKFNKNLTAAKAKDAALTSLRLRKRRAGENIDGDRRATVLNEYDEDIDVLQGIDANEVAMGGSMYEVEIDAAPDELLDYDVPLGKQSEEHQRHINEIADNLTEDQLANLDGDKSLLANPDSYPVEFLNTMAAITGSDSAGENALQALGVKGIKYADAQTRFSPGEKTRNFVIFDDRLINIAKKYGFNADALGNVGLYGGATALIAAGMSPEDAQASVEAAQTKSARGDIGNPVDRLMQPVDPRLGSMSQIAPVEEGYRDAAERRLAYMLGDDRQDFRTAEKVFGALDFVPGIGDVQAGVDVRDAAVRGDYLEAGVSSLGLLPLAGGALAKGGKDLIDYLKLPTVDREMSLMQRVGDVDSVNNMNLEYEAGPQTLNLPMLRAEQLLNRPYVSTMADTTRGQGETVTKVDDVEVDATMHGGQDHMVRPGNMQEGSLWASADGAVSGIMNAARQASEIPGAEGKPLFMGYGMAGTSPMFATFTGDVALPVAQARMSPAAKKALDKRIREGSGKVTGVKDWPGIDSPNVYEFMLGAGGKRKKVLDALDEFRGEGALNSSQVRTIVTDPRQLNPQVGALMNVGEIDLNRTPFPSLHPTYNTSVPGTPLGQFGSGFNVLEAKPHNRSGQVFTEEMQTRGHDLSADKLPAQVGKAMQGGLIGVLDEDVINDLVTRGIVKP